ncbi:hypothetical protein BH23VER1_BH23VER1_21010 [soil metagenome]
MPLAGGGSYQTRSSNWKGRIGSAQIFRPGMDSC